MGIRSLTCRVRCQVGERRARLHVPGCAAGRGHHRCFTHHARICRLAAWVHGVRPGKIGRGLAARARTSWPRYTLSSHTWLLGWDDVHHRGLWPWGWDRLERSRSMGVDTRHRRRLGLALSKKRMRHIPCRCTTHGALHRLRRRRRWSSCLLAPCSQQRGGGQSCARFGCARFGRREPTTFVRAFIARRRGKHRIDTAIGLACPVRRLHPTRGASPLPGSATRVRNLSNTHNSTTTKSLDPPSTTCWAARHAHCPA